MSEKDLFPDKEETSLMDSFRWWEKRRFLYNVIVGVSGIGGMLYFIGRIPYTLYDIIGMLAWAAAANTCYFAGFLIEPFFKYYFKSTIDFADKRSNFFWAGAVLSAVLTVICSKLSNYLLIH
jgi:hypothetical protein